jgi:hypothetical protein
MAITLAETNSDLTRPSKRFLSAGLSSADWSSSA